MYAESRLRSEIEANDWPEEMNRRLLDLPTLIDELHENFDFKLIPTALDWELAVNVRYIITKPAMKGRTVSSLSGPYNDL